MIKLSSSLFIISLAFKLPSFNIKAYEKSLFNKDTTDLTKEQKAVFNVIKNQENITFEEIVLKAGLTIQSVSGILIELQLIGKIKQETGNRFLAI